MTYKRGFVPHLHSANFISGALLMYQRRYALLLDAGFVKRKLRPFSADALQRLVEAIQRQESLAGHPLHRIYYYDAAPLGRAVEHPVDGSTIEYSNTQVFKESKELHDQVARLPHFAFRRGECTHDGWHAKFRALKNAGKYDATTGTLSLKLDDLKPVIRQKGVDMRIGMDIAALTLKKHVEVIVLVTADSDFVPAMKFARREGAQLYLFSLGHGARDEMFENADLVVTTTADALIEALTPKA